MPGSPQDKTILIAGAGIAGLTAALAFSRRGFPVLIFERAPALEEIGAGIQLSPNATRILRDLGLLDAILPHAVRPDAVVLRRAATLAEVGRVTMGAFAEQRWGAPYLTVHRADLQKALAEAAMASPRVNITFGATAQDFDLDGQPGLNVEQDGEQSEHRGHLAIGADGVWSSIRAQAGKIGASRFIGQLAWRRTLAADSSEGAALLAACPGVAVNAFLHKGFHLIAYPVRGGREINLAAFTPYRREMKSDWAARPNVEILRRAMTGIHPALASLAGTDAAWTAYPVHVADMDGAWLDPAGLALIGDAAHAMTPFAAQGAAMAIEDAVTLADAIANGGDQPAALQAWGIARRRRVLRVARRGALNQFAWHAGGPVAIARDLFVRTRGPEKLAADLDWLYGWKAGSD